MVAHPYAVNVDVAVRRPADDANGSPHEYLFIVRSEDEDHAPGTLAFPGGTLEAPPGEERVLERTARREVHEEVGVDVENLVLVTTTTFELDGGGRCLEVLYRADHGGGEAHRADPEEVAEVDWRDPETVATAESTPPWVRDLLSDVRATADR